MPALTRRRSDNPHRETWHICYGDERVGTIGERAGVPVGVDQWEWSCGFYPGLHPGQHRYGIVPTFAEARAGFEADWHQLLAELPEGAFDEYRRDREARAEVRAKRARGEKLDSEIPSSMMRCACGIRFDSHVSAANLVHLPHIYAAQAKSSNREIPKSIPHRSRT